MLRYVAQYGGGVSVDLSDDFFATASSYVGRPEAAFSLWRSTYSVTEFRNMGLLGRAMAKIMLKEGDVLGLRTAGWRARPLQYYIWLN